VVKKSLNSPEDWKHPNAGATVTVTYTGMLSDGTIFDARGQKDPLIFVTEEDQCPCEGLELAIMKMKLGEHALVTIHPEYGFGSQGATQPQAVVPGEATLTYDITLSAFDNFKESWDMETSEKLEAAHSLKEKGNQAFKAGKITHALKFWERAKSFAEFHDSFDSESKLRAKSILRSIDLNMSVAYLKDNGIGMAQTFASKVLENDPYNMKALYRRAQAYIKNGDWVEASQDIKTALGNEPENKDFMLLARQLKVAEANSSKSQAKIWASTFAKMRKTEVS
jgi:tetratricopeptide (TPR) repeat protein